VKSDGFIGQDVLAQIRSANDIVEVIQWLNVPMKKAGTSYRALCPFHKEKTPSFHANQQRQSFHCFGCGVGGDVFKFVMLRENVPFVEAVRRLAERARITLPSDFRYEGGGGPSRQQLYDLLSKVTDWYHLKLMRSHEADPARKYLSGRHFNMATAKTFRLGYSPSAWDGLIQWAREQSIEIALLEAAGLVLKGERGHYDRFRGRLMIPIADESGRVAGFSARILDPKAKEAKYVNSPETAVFKKGHLLFGLDRSKRDILETKVAVMCEGQLDWIRCFEAGIHNVVAPQGTAFTDDQARILGRYAETVILCFDADAAGQKATWRNAEILIAAGLAVKAAKMKAGEDPDTFVLKFGAEKMQELLSQAVDVFEYKARWLAGTLDMRNAQHQRKAVFEMIPLFNLVDNKPQRDRLVQNVASILRMDGLALLEEYERQRRRTMRRVDGAAPQTTSTEMEKGEIEVVGDYLLRLALMHEGAVRMMSGHLEERWFSQYSLRIPFLHILQRYREGRWKAGWDGLDVDLDDGARQRITVLLMHSMEENPRSLAIGLQDFLAAAHRIYLTRQHDQCLQALQDPKLQDAERVRLQSEVNELKRQLLDLSAHVRHT
jgi:DNA primase